jgi:hypothetical protein
MKLLGLPFLCLLFAIGCAHRAPVTIPGATLTHGGQWLSVEDPPGHFFVLSNSNEAEKEALKAVCPKGVICIEVKRMRAVVIEKKSPAIGGSK